MKINRKIKEKSIYREKILHNITNIIRMKKLLRKLKKDKKIYSLLF